jgi:hypothetical protein
MTYSCRETGNWSISSEGVVQAVQTTQGEGTKEADEEAGWTGCGKLRQQTHRFSSKQEV